MKVNVFLPPDSILHLSITTENRVEKFYSYSQKIPSDQLKNLKFDVFSTLLLVFESVVKVLFITVFKSVKDFCVSLTIMFYIN